MRAKGTATPRASPAVSCAAVQCSPHTAAKRQRTSEPPRTLSAVTSSAVAPAAGPRGGSSCESVGGAYASKIKSLAENCWPLSESSRGPG